MRKRFCDIYWCMWLMVGQLETIFSDFLQKFRIFATQFDIDTLILIYVPLEHTQPTKPKRLFRFFRLILNFYLFFSPSFRNSTFFHISFFYFCCYCYFSSIFFASLGCYFCYLRSVNNTKDLFKKYKVRREAKKLIYIILFSLKNVCFFARLLILYKSYFLPQILCDCKPNLFIMYGF